MRNKVFKRITAILITASLLIGGSFGVYADSLSENAIDNQNDTETEETQVVYEDESGEVIDEHAPAVIYEDNPDQPEDEPESSVVYESDEEYEEDSVSENEFSELLEEDFEDDTVSENEIEEDTVSENDIEDTVSENEIDPVTEIEADAEEAEDWFIELVNDYIKDTNDCLAEAYRLTSDIEEGDMLFPVKAGFFTENIVSGKNYYVLSEGYNNTLFYTEPLFIDENHIIVNLTDMVGNVAVIEKDGFAFEEQELETEFDGMRFKVSGEMPKDSRLEVSFLDKEKYEDMVEDQTGDYLAALYDVCIKYNENDTYEPSDFGRVVNMTIEGLDSVHQGSAGIIHITEDDEVEVKTPKVDTLFSTDSVEFVMDSFSPTGVITATSRLQKIEDPGVTISLIGRTPDHPIFRMWLEHGGVEEEAFCLNSDRSASSEEGYIQKNTFQTDSIRKILDVFYDASFNAGRTKFTYPEAQGLIWAAQRGYTSEDNMVSVLTDVQDSLTPPADTTRINAVVTEIQARTPAGIYYRWQHATNPTGNQEFVTLVGVPIDPSTDYPTPVGDICGPMWQIGDQAYAYVNITKKSLNVVGYGETWNMSRYGLYTTGRGSVPDELLGAQRQWDTEVFYQNKTTNEYSFVAPASLDEWDTLDYKDYITSLVVDSAITGFGDYFIPGSPNDYAELITSYSVDWHGISIVGRAAFCDCKYLTGNVEMDDVQHIGYNAFRNTKITGLTLNGNYAEIAENILSFDDPETDLANFNLTYNIARTITLHNNASSETYEYDNRYDDYSIFEGIVDCLPDDTADGFTVVIGNDCVMIPAKFFIGCCASTLDLEGAASLEEIQRNAFENMKHISQITIPSRVTNIGERIILGCDDITSIDYKAKDLEKYPNEGIFLYATTASRPKMFQTYKVNYETSGTPLDEAKDISFTIDAYVRALPRYLLPDNTRKLFFNSVIIDGIPSYFAEGCTRLDTLTFNSPCAVKYIGIKAFNHCEKLGTGTPVNFEALGSLKAIDESAFDYTALGTVALPNNVECIASYAFAHNETMRTFDTGSGLKYIGRTILAGNTGLTDIYYNAVNAENGCKRTIEVDEETGEYLWEPEVRSETKDYLADYRDDSEKGVEDTNPHYIGCFYQETVAAGAHGNYAPGTDVNLHIGTDVETIGYQVFAYDDCTHLTFPSSGNTVKLRKIGENAFAGSMVSGDIVLPEGVTTLATNCFGAYVATFGSYSYFRDYIDAVTSNIQSFTIPSTVTKATWVLYHREKLEKLCYNAKNANPDAGSYGSSVCEAAGIASDEFVIEIGSGVESIPCGAFSDCGVTSVVWKEPVNTKLKEIKTRTFENCAWLEEIEIPDTVETIGRNSFDYNLRLTKITIPASVTEILGQPFDNLGRNYDQPDGQDIKYITTPATVNLDSLYGNTQNTVTTVCDHDANDDGTPDMLETEIVSTNPAAVNYKWLLDSRWVGDLSSDVTVKFVANADTANPDDQTVATGERITEPTTPRKAGYDFFGWWTEETAINAEDGEGVKWDFNNPVNESMTLYAWWRQKATVAFNINGGTGTTPASVTDYVGNEADLPDDSNFSKRGYEFKGWAESTTSTTLVADPYIIPAGGKTLFAVWEAKPAKYEIILPMNVKLTPDEDDVSSLSNTFPVEISTEFIPKDLVITLATVPDSLKNSDNATLSFDMRKESGEVTIANDKQSATKTIPALTEDEVDSFEIGLYSTATAIGEYSGGKINVSATMN